MRLALATMSVCQTDNILNNVDYDTLRLFMVISQQAGPQARRRTAGQPVEAVQVEMLFLCLPQPGQLRSFGVACLLTRTPAGKSIPTPFVSFALSADGVPLACQGRYRRVRQGALQPECVQIL
jgi:hypothetical protein